MGGWLGRTPVIGVRGVVAVWGAGEGLWGETFGGVVVGCVGWGLVGVGLVLLVSVWGFVCPLMVMLWAWVWWGFVYLVDMGA